MAAGEPPQAVVSFCRQLRRLVRECGIAQSDVARALHRSNGAVSALLNGQRATPPAWDDVARIVEYCGIRRASPPAGVSLDLSWWRLRHHEMEMSTEEPPREQRPRPDLLPSPPPEPDEVPDDFASAIDVLAAGREDFEGLAAELLEPLTLSGAATIGLPALLEGFGDRVRSRHGVPRTALLAAADRAILISAFCEAVADSGIHYGPELGYQQGDITTQIVTELEQVVLGTDRVRDAGELRREITAAYTYAAGIVHGEGSPQDQYPEDLAHQAWKRYEALIASATWDCPELRLTSNTEDPPEVAEQGAQPNWPSCALRPLSHWLGQFAADSTPAHRYRRLLRAPLADAEEAGPAMPTLENGYVDPAFRLAHQHSGGRHLSSDDWWLTQPEREDLGDFLAAHLLTAHATSAPLVILGHPGAGKSLLTKLLAARLPEAEFFCQRVELRHIPADLNVQDQLEESLRRSTGRSTSWPEAARPGMVRVVVLDGFDELLQAASADHARYSNYLHDLADFQLREYELGRPTIAVVTSRTVVADQAPTPRLSTVIRLEPFDDDRIGHWVKVWNTANRRYFTAHGLQPLDRDVLQPHSDLISQPLLLLMLALYDASSNALHQLRGEDIGRLGLYERLLTEFTRRQVAKHNGALPRPAEAAAVEHELRRLAVIAIGMFNRRRQGITASEAHADQAALLDADVAPSPLLFGSFFFIHEAQAVVTGQHRHSYEFLHATFGEYLTARLIIDELKQHLLHADNPHPAASADDDRLHALLSHVPLADRAEVVQNLTDLISSLSQQHSHLTTLLIHLFKAATGDNTPPDRPPYEPLPARRGEREAVYSVNLLLLAVLVEDSVRVSRLFDARNPVDSWRRQSMLWRSQLGEASWTTLTGTLTTEPYTDPHTRDLDVRVRLIPANCADGLVWPPARDPQAPHVGPYRHHEPSNLVNLYRAAAFTHDISSLHILHAVAPLAQHLPTALEIYHVTDDQHARSAAHTLLALLDPLTPTPFAAPAGLLDLLNTMPARERTSAAELLARFLLHAVPHQPTGALTDVLDQLTSLRATGSHGLGATAWLILAQCAQALIGHPDTVHARLEVITARFGPQAPALDGAGPLQRLQCLLIEAGTTATWSAVERPAAATILTTALELLQQVPPANRTAHTVIELLRLAQDLDAADWLAEHAEPLLSALAPDGLLRLRPTDINWLRPAVRNESLLAELDQIRSRWHRT
ncbi:NACHT N-terminal helical domain 7-containing protein [Streptomyces griseoluteus]|uniref:NACHT N-terminal helical domain 7-containing protein n=1 Tax=Streptomyces griseoluteus TaxID=29306 RepID=UPI003417E02B